MSEAKPLTGQCMCGAVTVAATRARSSLSACHCDMCRRWSSSTFMSVPTVEGSARVEGPVRVYESSEWAERAFCSNCGSNIWYRITAEGPGHGQHQFAAGLFDVSDMRLGLEVFIDSKPDAYAFAGDRRQMTAQECFDFYEPKDSPEDK